MAEPATVEQLEQSIRDAQDRFNQGMGADGDASPYPMLKKLRAGDESAEYRLIMANWDAVNDSYKPKFKEREYMLFVDVESGEGRLFGSLY